MGFIWVVVLVWIIFWILFFGFVIFLLVFLILSGLCFLMYNSKKWRKVKLFEIFFLLLVLIIFVKKEKEDDFLYLSVLKFVKVEKDKVDIICKFLVLNWLFIFFLIIRNKSIFSESVSVISSIIIMLSRVKVFLRELIVVVIVVNKRGLNVKNNDIYVSGWLDYSVINFDSCLV